ncbi:MAG: hypothetical protein M1G31_04110 [Pseudanabaena sp. Salubria-1]|nr:hypothetical protein [Pseudanabaena sp. Salubria-1]
MFFVGDWAIVLCEVSGCAIVFWVRDWAIAFLLRNDWAIVLLLNYAKVRLSNG